MGKGVKIEIMDTTLRDGEQTSGVSFVPHEKLMIARLLLEELKVDRVEVASARVSDGEFDAVKMICARFLKATTKEGFGENLFRDWRYDKQGNKIDSFVLNDPTYGGQILVAGKNFGSGSSREHAAWAIADYGFRVVVSSFFADIHKNNELNNFVLPVVVTEEFLAELFDSIFKNPKMEVEVNLPEQTITNKATGKSEHFEINAYKKHCLMNGLDDIDFLLTNKDKIEQWEKASK